MSTAGVAETTGDLPAVIPDTIRVGVGASIVSIDPNQATQEVDVMALGLISGTLMVQREGKAAPGLATRLSIRRLAAQLHVHAAEWLDVLRRKSADRRGCCGDIRTCPPRPRQRQCRHHRVPGLGDGAQHHRESSSP